MKLENVIDEIIKYAEKGYQWEIVPRNEKWQDNYLYDPKNNVYVDNSIFNNDFTLLEFFTYGSFHPIKTMKFVHAIYKLRLPENKRKNKN